MSPAVIYSNGRIQDIEAAKKAIIVPKPKPALFTSSSNPWGALVLGIIAFCFGASIIFGTVADLGTEWPPLRVLVTLMALASLPVGFITVRKALSGFHKVAHPVSFFYYDDAHIVMGTTNALDRVAVKKIRSMPRGERISELMARSQGPTKIPVLGVEHVGITIDRITRHIGKMRIRSSGAEIVVDIPGLLPTGDISGRSDKAFNSISQYYTQATGAAMKVSIENP
jgi:hypothetical protein